MENIICEVTVHFLEIFKRDSAYINTFK